MLRPRGITSQGGIVHYKSPAFFFTCNKNCHLSAIADHIYQKKLDLDKFDQGSLQRGKTDISQSSKERDPVPPYSLQWVISVIHCLTQINIQWYWYTDSHSMGVAPPLGMGGGHELSKLCGSHLETPSSRTPPRPSSGSGSVSHNSVTICWGWRRVSPKYLIQK